MPSSCRTSCGATRIATDDVSWTGDSPAGTFALSGINATAAASDDPPPPGDIALPLHARPARCSPSPYLHGLPPGTAPNSPPSQMRKQFRRASSSSQLLVHTASLEAAPGSRQDFWRDLSADEKARADRYATPQLRERYVAARGILRRLLASYLSIDARALVFGYGAKGKPHLVGIEGLAFNLSHADGMAIYAIASGREIGIDIESMLRPVDVDGIARTAFSPRECGMLATLPEEARRAAFFRMWTRKEAYIKARGEGFGYPTKSFSVSHDADDDALIGDDGDADARLRWRVRSLDAPPGFAAAVAATGNDWSVVRIDPGIDAALAPQDIA